MIQTHNSSVPFLRLLGEGMAEKTCHAFASTTQVGITQVLDRRSHHLARLTVCIYTRSMEFTWSERKRSLNLRQHGLDFVDAPAVFGGLTFTFEDDRFSYSEQRFVTLGLLAGVPVSIVHTETAHEIRIISFRKATRQEAELFFSAVQD